MRDAAALQTHAHKHARAWYAPLLMHASRSLPRCSPAASPPGCTAANLALWGGLCAGGLALVAMLQYIFDLLGARTAAGVLSVKALHAA